ncbi:hypothetical protein SEA_LUCKYLEO_10 [Gordonia phage LuckyLeo]|nr:hypothetical protein SEA_LUCKYLEO_10 [Gordonia phage LuckyLeo]
MSKIRRINAPNVSGGRAWGNALGGFKTQRRNSLGEFARSGQKTNRERYLDAIAKSRRRGKVAPARKIKNPNSKTPYGKAAMKSTAVQVVGGSKIKKGVAFAGGTAGVITLIRMISGTSPFIDVSRKNLRVGVKPSVGLGGKFKLSTVHSIGIERVGDDAFDRAIKRGQEGISAGTRKLFGEGQRGDLAVGIADNITGRQKQVTIAGTKLTQESGGAGSPRRWRYSAGSGSGKAAVPGSPAGAKNAKSKRKPGKGAHTVTTTSKGKPAVRGQRRGKKAKSANQKRRRRSYTK